MYLPRVLTALSRVTAVAKCFPLVDVAVQFSAVSRVN